MWPDVAQQLTNVVAAEVFDCLLNTPSYKVFLQKGGLSPPFEKYLFGRTPVPGSLQGMARLYAKQITGDVQALNCLAEDRTLRAEVLHGPLRLFRVVSSRTRGPEPQDLRRHTADIGDWWFHEELLEECVLQCRAQEQTRRGFPLLTDMTPDRCLKTLLRRRLAIRLDWNALGAIRKLVLAPNESIPVITGIGLPQRAISPNAPRSRFPAAGTRAAAMALPGGDRQIWMPWTPQKQIQLWTPKGGFGPQAQL